MLLLLKYALLIAGQMTSAVPALVISAYKAVLCLIVCKALLCVSFHLVGSFEKKDLSLVLTLVITAPMLSLV